MLERLMKQLVSDEIATLEELAKRLSVSDGLVEQMLNDLARGGYIELIDMSCSTDCKCEGASICSMLQGKRLWRVTDKGFRLARSL